MKQCKLEVLNDAKGGKMCTSAGVAIVFDTSILSQARKEIDAKPITRRHSNENFSI